MNVLLVGHPVGIKQLLKFLPTKMICGIMGAGNRPQFHAELTSLAHQLQVPLLIQPKKSEPYWMEREREREIAITKPDILLCNVYSMLLPSSLLAIPKLCVNCHASWVPFFRGANPRQWALIHNSQKHGVTLHKMSSALDEGDTLCVKTFPISITDTWKDLYQQDQKIAETLWETYLPKILTGENLSFTPQNAQQAKTWPHRKPEDGRLTREMSIQLIYNTVRALVAPLPGAFWEDERSVERWDQFLPLQKIAFRVSQWRRWETANGRILIPEETQSFDTLSFHLLSSNGSNIPVTIEIEGNMRLLKIRTSKNLLTPSMQELLLRFCSDEFPLSQTSWIA